MADPATRIDTESVAETILKAFSDYQRGFDTITRRANTRFMNRDWRGAHADVVERIELYKSAVARLVADVDLTWRRPGDFLEIGKRIKADYQRAIEGRDDTELAKTFYNSVTRRIFSTIGVEREIEFVDTDFEVPSNRTPHCGLCRQIPYRGSIRHLIQDIFARFQDEIALSDPGLDLDLAAEEMNRRFLAMGVRLDQARVDVYDAPFYRNKAAYIIGCIVLPSVTLPLVFALLHDKNGVYVDAILLNEEEISILFSFTRSYFRVRTTRPWELARFLNTLMPIKPVSEIYTSVGYHKHGKAELFRELERHLQQSDDRFVNAEGERGMVMVAFTLPSFDVVFKVIRDRFDYPKRTSRQSVLERYHLVFRHDRAGRLIDAQEFEYMKFDRGRFSDRLLSELKQSASHSVAMDDRHVIFRHVYTERRVTPLDVYLRNVGESEARNVVRDYGRAIKELAVSNIFPGDLFLKNFGVTRTGRVIFYDYDELCLLSDCRFRAMPAPTQPEDEMASEPWYFVDENDVFPEEFDTFFRFPKELRELFVRHHGELFDLAYWQTLQADIRAGKEMHIFPYHRDRRLRQVPVLR